MAVCLHCGELAPDGALFCTKCGYTLPQVEAAPAVAAPAPAPVPPPPPPPAAVYSTVYAPGPPASYVVPLPPGAVGPMAPPPSGKFCTHCRTIIARTAAFCPVCQSPQP